MSCGKKLLTMRKIADGEQEQHLHNKWNKINLLIGKGFLWRLMISFHRLAFQS